MNRRILILLPLLALLLSACPVYEGGEIVPPTNYTPLFMPRSQLETSIASVGVQKTIQPGKIVLYQNYIYLVERYKGVHVIDNSNPASPQKMSFIRIPGCIDIAIRNDLLFADNAVDLVSLSIQNPLQIQVIAREKDVFPEMNPPDMGTIPEIYRKENRKPGLIIVAWNEK